MASHPPTNVHTGEHSVVDTHFLMNMGAQLRATVAMADSHAMNTGANPATRALATQISASHASQLVRVDGLKARLGNATAGTSSSTGVSGPGASGGGSGGQGGGGGGGGGYGRSWLEILEERATKAPYGEVTYADPGYQSDKVKRYPLDSEAHCRAAWSYINMPKNAAKYSASQLAAIKGRIRSAAKRFGIQIGEGVSSANSQNLYGFVERAR